MFGWNAWASPPAFIPVVSRMDSTPRSSNALFPLKLPRYEQWRKLSAPARAQMILDLQEFLLQEDALIRKDSSHEAQVLKQWLNLWLEEAQAKPRKQQQQSFCINQGVVKPLSQCDTSLGYKMHDFDTNEVLSKLGPASQCPEGEKPCSPAFGFSAEGQMFCSSKNLTRDCAKKSQAPGTIPLADVLMSCGAGSPGVPKVDCKALISFFDQQLEAVEQFCKKSPSRMACGILRQQVQSVMQDASQKKKALSETGLEKVADVVAATNEAAKMSESNPPCPTDPKPSSPASPQAPSDTHSTCVQATLSKNANKPTLDALLQVLAEKSGENANCGELSLPGEGKIAFNRSKQLVVVQASHGAKPVALNMTDLDVLNAVSNMLLEPSFKVPAKDLLAHYLPKEELKEPGKISLEDKATKTKKEFPTKGWLSANGTRIRYVPDGAFGDKNHPVLVAAILLPGSSKETLFGIPIKSEQ
jgi:hypothetical protein